MARGGFLRNGDRSALERFPADISFEDVARCFSLSASDLDLAWARSGAAGRLAAGLKIGAIRLLGFVPEDWGRRRGRCRFCIVTDRRGHR